MAALGRIPPQLEAPQEARESPETARGSRRGQGPTPPRAGLRGAHGGPGGVGYSSSRKEVYMVDYMDGLADPGGRYAVQLLSGGSRQDETLAKTLNEGDARGWYPVHIVYSDLHPHGIYIVWDKQGH
jgi:hypothetical protein